MVPHSTTAAFTGLLLAAITPMILIKFESQNYKNTESLVGGCVCDTLLIFSLKYPSRLTGRNLAHLQQITAGGPRWP